MNIEELLKRISQEQKANNNMIIETIKNNEITINRQNDTISQQNDTIKKLQLSINNITDNLNNKINELDKRNKELNETLRKNQAYYEKNTVLKKELEAERQKKEKALALLSIIEQENENDLIEQAEMDKIAKETTEFLDKRQADINFNRALRNKRMKEGLKEYHEPLYTLLHKGEKQLEEFNKEDLQAVNKRKTETRRKNKESKLANEDNNNGKGEINLPDINEILQKDDER